MATIQDAIIGISLYPIPSRTLQEIAARRGLVLIEEATQGVLTTAAFNLAKADALMWLSLAPNVTQGGQSYSFSDEQRLQFRNRANSLYKEFAADDTEKPKAVYGYKGSRL